MAKISQLDKILASFDDQIKVLQLARQKVIEQQQAQKPKTPRARPRAVAREETAS